jgi:hypothetical protein
MGIGNRLRRLVRSNRTPHDTTPAQGRQNGEHKVRDGAGPHVVTAPEPVPRPTDGLPPLRLRAASTQATLANSTAITTGQSAREFLTRAQRDYEAANQAFVTLAAFEDPDEPDLVARDRASDEWGIAIIRLDIAQAIAYSFAITNDSSNLPDGPYKLPSITPSAEMRGKAMALIAMLDEQDAEIQRRFDNSRRPAAAPVDATALQAGRVALTRIAVSLSEIAFESEAALR